MTGSGTAGDPYVISDVDDLQLVGSGGDSSPYARSAYYQLGSDIEALETSGWNSGAGFVPLCPDDGGSISTWAFIGHFDGRGHTIKDLYINRSTTDYVGLFSGMYYDSGDPTDMMTDFKLNHFFVRGRDYVGSVVGYALCFKSRQISYVAVDGGAGASLVVGRDRIGGFGGVASGDRFCSVNMVYCYGYDAGDVSPKIGGFTAGGDYINSCYCKKGFCYGNNAYYKLSGFICTTSPSVTSVAASYAVTALSGPSGVKKDGFSTEWGIGNAQPSNCYFDGQAGYGESDGGIELTTAEAKLQASYVGWDFTNIWSINPSINDGYPYLQAKAAGAVPTVTTTDAADILSVSATLGGNITANGGYPILQRIIQFGSQSGLYDHQLVDYADAPYAIGAWTRSVITLKPNTTYYFRAGANNGEGWGYGTVKSFITSVGVPTVTTVPATFVSSIGAILNGICDLLNAASVTQIGFDWGKTSGALDNSWTDDSTTYTTEPFSFLYAVTGLDSDTWYFRAKAYNANGWGYGQELVIEEYESKPDDKLARVTSIIHRTIPGSITIEAGLGGFGSVMTSAGAKGEPLTAIPQWSKVPTGRELIKLTTKLARIARDAKTAYSGTVEHVYPSDIPGVSSSDEFDLG